MMSTIEGLWCSKVAFVSGLTTAIHAQLPCLTLHRVRKDKCLEQEKKLNNNGLGYTYINRNVKVPLFLDFHIKWDSLMAASAVSTISKSQITLAMHLPLMKLKLFILNNLSQKTDMEIV